MAAAILATFPFLLGAGHENAERAAKQQLRKTCARCHSLEVVRAQRLTQSEWSRELDKMAAMGAKIRDRNALLRYLSTKYGASETGTDK